MRELILTRQNHLVDPSLHVWAWQIPIYLFLGGLVAGMMVLSGIFLWQDRHRERPFTASMTPLLGLVFLSLGMGALFLDLEHKLYTWRLYLTFQPTSPMSWGAWILIVVYPALVLAALVHPPEPLRELVPAVRRWSDLLAQRPSTRRLIGAVNIGLGAALGIYTGILLSSLGARPLWNSAILGPLFLLSGLSSAAAFIHLVARHDGERVGLARADNLFLTMELAALVLFVIGLANATAAHRAAAALVLGGAYTSIFWVGVVGLGVVVPLIIQSLAVNHRVQHSPAAPLMVMAGGLLLRFVIVSAGQASHWAAVLHDLFRALA